MLTLLLTIAGLILGGFAVMIITIILASLIGIGSVFAELIGFLAAGGIVIVIAAIIIWKMCKGGDK